ncbi:uncharacterized protein C4orf54-like [Electrophorus electricus]|uniref:uncharacterized protein C4orf54-like n=1 Tax=Electrophorus electricus TaxID=8005 RepID=UPI0015D0A5D0|nr:uncharacterized protein C4orf54-like [Electrophorus electricus]XP_035385823.1 uncharacterized protein C4orf54-like [Electrophorus electricus]
METLQTAITIGEASEPLKKPLITEKKHDDNGTGERSNESNYVDLGNMLDVKSDSAKTVKVTFTGEGNQLAIFKSRSDTSSTAVKSPGEREKHDITAKVPLKDHADHSKDIPVENDYPEALSGVPPSPCSTETKSEILGADIRKDVETDLKIGSFLAEENHHTRVYETRALKYADMYLNSRCESEDDTSVALSDKSAHDSVTVNAESHYITTHEIQLTELDHDVDYELGRGSCWDYEDDNLVYSFVDYASFESDETTEAPLETTDRSKRKGKSNLAQTSHVPTLAAAGALMSTESEFCESDKLASSDESPSKTQNDNSRGKIHLSIKASSRAIGDPINVLDDNENIYYYARRAGERSRYFLKTSDSNEDALYDRDRAQYFIPAPGRQHLASKLKGKDINEYSSGASSSVSELDDADKEVRNLTAKSFRSLACPYFDAINLRTSSESSVSEHGLSINKWSALVDFNYGNLTQGHEHNMLAHRNSMSSVEINKCAECKNVNGVAVTNMRTTQTDVFSPKNKRAQYSGQNGSPDSSKKVELQSSFQPARNETVTLTETLNFSLDGGLPTHERRVKCMQNATGSSSTVDASSPTPAKLGCEPGSQLFETDHNKEDVHTKAIFASSLLKNVISKKMQLEQERKMERGEICDACPPASPRPSSREQDLHRESVTAKGLQRETSETGSESSISSQEDLVDTMGSISRAYKEEAREGSHSSGTELELLGDATTPSKAEVCESGTGPLARSQNSAFKTWKDGEREISEASPQSYSKPACAPAEMSTTTPDHDGEERECAEGANVEAANSRTTKMSHLYVPSSHLVPKERERADLPLHNQSVQNELVQLEEEGCREIRLSDPPRAAVTSSCGQVRKAPEIKIRLRSVKEKNPFNIANLLTPNIGYNSNSVKHGGDSKSHLRSASEKVPHFMVRDIRDTKCKLRTPIHHVRDVRKLVKSSYRFVSLENTVNKLGVSALREDSKAAKKEPDNQSFPIPMVIKCQSVNTNSTPKRGSTVRQAFNGAEGESAREADVVRERLSPKHVSEYGKNESMCRAQGSKQLMFEQAEPKTEKVKSVKQKREKTVDICDKKPECKFANQVALEKLKAAVKTMEQLYVFDRNEWKRKTDAPRPVTDSHVLSLISSQEHGFACKIDSEGEQGKASDSEKPTSSESVAEKPCASLANVAGVVASEEKTLTKPESFDNRCVVGPGGALRTTQGPKTQQRSIRRNYASGSAKGPVCVKICPSKAKPKEIQRDRDTTSDTPTKPKQTHTPLPDSENYLTIPVKSEPADIKPALIPAAPNAKPHPPPFYPPVQRSPVVSESWSPEIPMACHHTFPAAYTHLLRFTPPMEAPAPTPAPQRKLLVDPATGQCYLVDLQPAIQRLYYPDSGRYLDVPLSVAPMPVPPIALSPAAAYAPAYLFCPPVLAPPLAQVPPGCPEGTGGAGTSGGAGTCANPLISVTSQQGARIIAPPSFDGTTVSFVVEHR